MISRWISLVPSYSLGGWTSRWIRSTGLRACTRCSRAPAPRDGPPAGHLGPEEPGRHFASFGPCRARSVLRGIQTRAVIDHATRRTVTEMDNVLFSSLTLNLAPLHLDAEYGKDTV